MESELGIVLREQQAFLSLLLTRVALVDGEERRLAFEALTLALLAHLSEWRSVLLPVAGKTGLAQQAAASGRLVARIVARTLVDRQGLGANKDIRTLITSVLSLLSRESTLLETTSSALPRPVQVVLTAKAEHEFTRLGRSVEPDKIRTQLEQIE